MQDGEREEEELAAGIKNLLMPSFFGWSSVAVFGAHLDVRLSLIRPQFGAPPSPESWSSPEIAAISSSPVLHPGRKFEVAGAGTDSRKTSFLRVEERTDGSMRMPFVQWESNERSRQRLNGRRCFCAKEKKEERRHSICASIRQKQQRAPVASGTRFLRVHVDTYEVNNRQSGRIVR